MVCHYYSFPRLESTITLLHNCKKNCTSAKIRTHSLLNTQINVSHSTHPGNTQHLNLCILIGFLKHFKNILSLSGKVFWISLSKYFVAQKWADVCSLVGSQEKGVKTFTSFRSSWGGGQPGCWGEHHPGQW